MKLPRVRFTVRRMMVAVAILGATLGIEATRRRIANLAQRYEHKAMLRLGLSKMHESEAANDYALARFWQLDMIKFIAIESTRSIETDSALASLINRGIPVGTADASEIARHRRLKEHIGHWG